MAGKRGNMILSQKALNRAINERMSTLTDGEVFLSEAYKHRLTQMSSGVLQASRGKSVTIAGDPGVTAYTDGVTRTINFNFDLVQKQPDREAKDKFIRGFNLHETAHCLLTDFALHKRFMEKLMKEHKFLCEPYANPYKEMTEKGIEKANVAMIFHNLDNSLEDGFINRAVQTAAPGYYEDLLFVLDQFAKVEQFSFAKEADKPKALLFSNMTLLYAVYGLKAYAPGEVLGNPLLRLFEEAIPWIDKAVLEADPKKRKSCVTTVFCFLFRAITMDWEDKKKEQQKQQGQQGQGSQDSDPQKGSKGNDSNNSSSDKSQKNNSKGSDDEDSDDGNSSEGDKAEGSSSEEKDDSDESSSGSSEGEDEEKDGSETEKSKASGESSAEDEYDEVEDTDGDEDESDEENAESEAAEGSNRAVKDQGEENDEEESESPSNGQGEASEGSSESQDGSPNGQGSSGLEIPDDPSEQSGDQGGKPSGDAGSNARENDPSADYGEPSAEELQSLADSLEKDMHSSEQADHSNADKKANEEAIEALKKAQEDPSARNEEAPAQDDMNKLEKELVKEELEKKQEEEIRRQLQADTAEISKEKMHKGIRCHVLRPERSEVTDALYEMEKVNLDSVVRRMSREFLKEIKERQTGDTMTGLYNGKQLDVNHLYRDDKRIFSQKILPEEIPDMAVGILVDCSGSMCGTRIENARRCAYVTYEFCKALNIPCFVFGHTTKREDVIMFSVADENSLDKDESERIFALQACNSNRDGYALRYCLKKLEKIEAKDRLMLVISDGQPAHYGYSQKEGKADLQDAVHTAIKKGIFTIAAGIDNDADSVKYVYKDGRSDKDSATFLEITDLDRLPKAFVKIIKKRLS